MPGQTPVHADETAQLLAYLEQHRYVLKLASYGLTDEQAKQTPTPSPLSVGGLIKHVATTELSWANMVRRQFVDRSEDYAAAFVLQDGETLAGVIAFYDEVAAGTASLIAGIASLDEPVPVPKGVPWFPQDLDAWTVRWVLLHLITETARHAGHADIVREAVDGGTAFPIMAAAEHWPASPWMTPWTPAGVE